MDFSYDEDQQAIVDLAAKLFAEQASHERQREIESRDGPRFDPALWSALAEAGLLGTAIPESHGGAGLGFLELAAVLEQAGRATAPVPLLETTVLGAWPLARFGSDALRARWLPAVARGDAILTAALIEPQGDPRAPAAVARPEGAGFVLDGAKTCVPAAALAHGIVVPARTPEGRSVLAVVAPDAPGVTLVDLVTTSGRPESRLELASVAVAADDVLAGPEKGAAALDDLLVTANAAQAAFGLGVCERALELTAEYAKTRKQFDQPIASFQAVGHRAADAFIDVQGIRLTTLQAAWRLSAGLPAAPQVAVAKYWVAEAGQRVVAACQHLHGGVGVDKEYPLHRSFLHAKEVELALGGATPQLLAIGRWLAATPASGSTPEAAPRRAHGAPAA